MKQLPPEAEAPAAWGVGAKLVGALLLPGPWEPDGSLWEPMAATPDDAAMVAGFTCIHKPKACSPCAAQWIKKHGHDPFQLH